MNITKVAVLTTLAAIIKKYKGNWSTAAQDTLLKLLNDFHDISIKRRMLGYHLADLRAAKLITTIRRNKRDDNGQLCLLSSATALTIKGCLLLFRLGNRWALKHLKYLKHRYQPQPPAPEKTLKPARGAPPQRSRGEDNPFLDPRFRATLGLPANPPIKV